VELKRLTDDFHRVGIEINLIAREVNTAEMTGRSPKGLDNIENLADELQRLIQRANALMGSWKTNPSDET